jgi:hypothetical protein
MNNTRDTFGQLRGSFDGQDPFMTGGHQIIKTRSSNRDVPEWALDNKKVQQILLRSFPKLKTDLKQRARAARWATIIQLFFRMKMTRKQVAEQTKLSSIIVRDLIRNIRRAASGRKTNGQGLAGKRPTGRPKKRSATH